MQNVQTISLKEARRLALHNQLLTNNSGLKGKAGVLKVIEQLGYIQIDTISIVERSHKHILWTRVPDFKEEMLSELIDKDRKVFEYWSHAAAYLPMKDYRFARFRKKKFTQFNSTWGKWAKKNKKVISYVHDRIKAEGPLQSRDFEHPKKRGTWWDWKPTKHALEYLFHTGELMLKARKNFQKIYDLSENLLPPGILTTEPSDEEHAEHLITNAIRSHGIVTQKEITYLKFYTPAAFKRTLGRMVEENRLIKIKIENLKSEYYTDIKALNSLNTLNTLSTKAYILSPFDNLVIQRKRLKDLFGFDYVIECYLPAHKRKFGYYCLPVLHGDKFIGRIDAKADRQNNSLDIVNFFPENSYRKTKHNLNKKLKELSIFSGCGGKVNFLNLPKNNK